MFVNTWCDSVSEETKIPLRIEILSILERPESKDFTKMNFMEILGINMLKLMQEEDNLEIWILVTQNREKIYILQLILSFRNLCLILYQNTQDPLLL